MTVTASREEACQEKSINKKKGIDLDKILTEEIGLGRYQLKILALCGLFTFITGLTSYNYVFTAQRLKTRCFIPECEPKNKGDLSPSWIANAVPALDQSFDNCYRFSPSNSSGNLTESCPAALFNRSHIEKCMEYIYENTNSAVYELDLACDDWRWGFIGSSRVLGTALAMPISGFLADVWGRRIALFFNMFNFGWINAFTYFSVSYTTYILATFFASVLGGSKVTCSYIIALEQVASKHRMLGGSILLTCLSLGTCVQGLVASTEPYWRNFILIVYIPMVMTISLFWVTPESVRWLLSKQRFKEAKTILMKGAKINGKTLSEETLKSFSEIINSDEAKEDVKSNLICLVFKYKTVLLHCLIAPVWWISILFVGKGLVIESVSISGNKYWNFIAAVAIEIPAHWLCLLFVDRVGRKPFLMVGFWICGASQLAFIFIPKGQLGWSLALYLTGKFWITAVSSVVYVYTAELFPTRYRTRLVTYTSMVGRVGDLIAPLTPALASSIWEHLPFALFGGMAFLSGLLLLLAPETLNSSLPESMEEANNLGKDTPPSRLRNILKRIVFKKKSYSL